MYKILTLPGDGVGPEVAREGIKVLRRVAEMAHLVFETSEALVGGASLDKESRPITEDVIKRAKDSDAVLLGAVGGEKWDQLPHEKRPEQALLALRSELGLFANLRPVAVDPSLMDASPLKREVIDGVDLLVVRELTGGIYFGKPRGFAKAEDGSEKAFNTLVYSEPEVARIAMLAFELARKRKRRLVSVDKANILEASILWRRVVTKMGRRFPDVALSHLYVDNCAMQLIRDPKPFDVILTSNMFGDILSDEAAMLTGSIGMLPSASLGGHYALYEPVHGSAPDIAGKNLANPIAMILSVAMMLRHTFHLIDLAIALEKAVADVLRDGFRTADLAAGGGKTVGTSEMGDLIAERVRP